MASDNLARPPSLTHRILVLAVGFILIMVCAGITHNYGVIMVTFIDEFDISTSDAAWAAGIEQFFCYVTGALVLPIVEMLGWRVSALCGTLLASLGLLLTSFISEFYIIYLTYGIFTGIGLGVLLLLAFVVGQNMWEDNMLMAFTVVTLGFETGLMSFGPLIQLFLDTLGWRGTQRMLGLITLFVGICAVIAYQPLNNQSPDSESDQSETNTETGSAKTKKETNTETQPLLNNTQEDANTETQPLIRTARPQTSLCTQLKDRFMETWKFYTRLDFILLGIAFFGFTWSYDSPYIFLPLRAQTLGIDALKSTTILVIFGLSGFIIRLTLLFVPNTSFKMTVASTGVCLFVAGAVSTLMPLFTTYTTLAVYAAIVGCPLAYVFSSYMYIVAGIVGMKSKDEATAGTIAFCAFADLANAPAGGAILEATGNNNSPFLLTGAVGIFCSFIYMATVFWKRKSIQMFHNQQKAKTHSVTEIESSQAEA